MNLIIIGALIGLAFSAAWKNLYLTAILALFVAAYLAGPTLTLRILP